MTTLFGDVEEQKPSDLLDPKHWYLAQAAANGWVETRNMLKDKAKAKA